MGKRQFLQGGKKFMLDNRRASKAGMTVCPWLWAAACSAPALTGGLFKQLHAAGKVGKGMGLQYGLVWSCIVEYSIAMVIDLALH